MKLKSIFISSVLIIICCCLPGVSFSQGGPFDNNGTGTTNGPPSTPSDPIDTTSVPFDGGLSILIGAGVVYGIKKYKNRKNQGGIDNTIL